MKDLHLTVDRKWKKSAYTIGRLYIDGVYFCDTLEPRDRGLKQTDSLAVIRRNKIPSQTAIPTGTYQLTLGVQSAKYSAAKYAKQYGFCRGYLPRVLNVPGFDGVLIHIGNSKEDTAACLLVGKNKQVGRVLESTATFLRLYPILDAARKAGKMIWITYK